MITVKAKEMAPASPARDGWALYGIYFDTDKTEVTPEPNPTLEQIGLLMKSDPKLSLLVV